MPRNNQVSEKAVQIAGSSRQRTQQVRRSGVVWEPDWSPSSWSPLVPGSVRWARFGSGDLGDGVHGFVEDWRLEALARGHFGGLGLGRSWVVEPDFSVLQGMPEHVIGWQVYRARFIGSYLRALGYRVVPVLQWAGPDSFDSAFWGVLPGSAVAVRAPCPEGTERLAWSRGFSAAVERLSPSQVLVFGVASRVRAVVEQTGVPALYVPLRRSRVGVVL